MWRSGLGAAYLLPCISLVAGFRRIPPTPRIVEFPLFLFRQHFPSTFMLFGEAPFDIRKRKRFAV
jgi:hypothetical protein